MLKVLLQKLSHLNLGLLNDCKECFDMKNNYIAPNAKLIMIMTADVIAFSTESVLGENDWNGKSIQVFLVSTAIIQSKRLPELA